LVYPAFVLALCALLLIFAPVLVFSDLLDLLAELKTDLPLPTKLYLGFSDLVRSPLAYLVLAAGLALVVVLARKLLQDEERRAEVEAVILQMPGLGPALKSAVSAEVTGALAVSYGSGLPLLSALNLSAEVSLSTLLRQKMEASRESLTAGETLSAALHETGFFSPVSLLILQAGEEVGQISPALESMARQSAESTRHALELMQKLLEPLLLLFVGMVVGFIAIATLAPTIKMVEGL
ncbi:MAG: type II secretion system F family protein, partial [Candidatus Eremiobacteraeota bacterium]|nr:type II secretion system F family protein [Candidatus Eremiobacteraeota bacterium]